jgi:hypothetical protein
VKLRRAFEDSIVDCCKGGSSPDYFPTRTALDTFFRRCIGVRASAAEPEAWAKHRRGMRITDEDVERDEVLSHVYYRGYEDGKQTATVASTPDDAEQPAAFDPIEALPGEYEVGQIVRAAVEHDPDTMRFYLRCSVGELAQRIMRRCIGVRREPIGCIVEAKGTNGWHFLWGLADANREDLHETARMDQSLDRMEGWRIRPLYIDRAPVPPDDTLREVDKLWPVRRDPDIG